MTKRHGPAPGYQDQDGTDYSVLALVLAYALVCAFWGYIIFTAVTS